MKMKRNNLFFPSFDIESSWNRSDCVRFFTVLYTVLRTRNSSAESEIKNGWFIWSIFLEIKGERERVCTLHRFQLGDWSVESMPIPSNVCSVRALDYSTRLKYDDDNRLQIRARILLDCRPPPNRVAYTARLFHLFLYPIIIRRLLRRRRGNYWFENQTFPLYDSRNHTARMRLRKFLEILLLGKIG